MIHGTRLTAQAFFLFLFSLPLTLFNYIALVVVICVIATSDWYVNQFVLSRYMTSFIIRFPHGVKIESVKGLPKEKERFTQPKFFYFCRLKMQKLCIQKVAKVHFNWNIVGEF